MYERCLISAMQCQIQGPGQIHDRKLSHVESVVSDIFNAVRGDLTNLNENARPCIKSQGLKDILKMLIACRCGASSRT